jgi:hypothetical protein
VATHALLDGPHRSVFRTLVIGTLTVGSLDLADALIFFGLRGVEPARILQSIASGLLGRDAYAGGAATVALGVLLHFAIIAVIVALYVAASRRAPSLVRRPWLYGPLYGLAVYVVMNRVVVPLSAAAVGPTTPAALVNGLLIHAFGVGLVTALFARAAQATPARR